MPELTQQQWLYVALGAAALFFAWRRGLFDNLLAKPKAPVQAAPVPQQPLVERVVEFRDVPAVVTLDDRVLSAARTLKEVSSQRAELKEAYAMVDAHDAASLAEQAKKQAQVNKLAKQMETTLPEGK